MDEKRCHDICAGCTAACPPPGVKCLFLESAEKREKLQKYALPPMMLDEDVRIDRAVEMDAFGVTYEGFDKQTGKSVTIREYLPFGERGENHRVCHQHPSVQQAFAEGLSGTGRKLAALAKIRHPGLVRCYAMMQENDTLYALYEPAEGRTLDELWNAIPVIEPRQAAVLFKPAAEALQAIIDSGIEPDAVTPHNIIVRNEDGLCVIAHMGTMPAQEEPQASLCAMLGRWLTGGDISPDAPERSFPDGLSMKMQEVLCKGLANGYASIKDLWTDFETAAACKPAASLASKAEAEPEEELESTFPLPATTEEPKEDSESEFFYSDSSGKIHSAKPKQDPLLKSALPFGARIGETVTLHVVLSRNGFGFEYKGYDEKLRKDVVVRELAPLTGERMENGHWLMRGWEMEMQRNVTMKENKLMNVHGLHHDGIVPIFGVIRGNDTLYVLRETVNGVTLPSLWENPTCTPDDVWSPKELVRFMSPAAEAIAALAEKKLLEPLKPENFLMEEGGCIRLIDICATYGTGKMNYHSDTTTAFPSQASAWYVAPELMGEEYDAEKAAQYTLCAVLYRMMTTTELPSWTKRAQPGATELCGSGFSEAVDAVLAKGLSLNPMNRYDSIAQLWEAFQKAAEGKENAQKEETSEEGESLPLDGRCFHCMEKAPVFGICPRCGYDNRITLDTGDYLCDVTLQGRYRTGRLLGRGDDYATYIGHDELLDQKIAIREFFPAHLTVRIDDCQICPHDLRDVSWIESFHRKRKENAEIIKMGRFGGVEALYDLFEENGTFYVIKEFAEGETLLDQIKRKQTYLSLNEAEAIFRPAAEALIHLHEKGFSHGDIHPGNLMVLSGGKRSMWIDVLNRKAKPGQEEKMELPPVRHHFHPIECYKRSSDTPPALTDQYSLCATLYYALMGERPPRVTDRVLGAETLKSICEINPSVTPAVEQVISKGMEIKAENRYPSMQAWLEAMEKACAAHPVGKKTSLWQKLGFKSKK